jgi:hypothetical protein
MLQSPEMKRINLVITPEELAAIRKAQSKAEKAGFRITETQALRGLIQAGIKSHFPEIAR